MTYILNLNLPTVTTKINSIYLRTFEPSERKFRDIYINIYRLI